MLNSTITNVTQLWHELIFNLTNDQALANMTSVPLRMLLQVLQTHLNVANMTTGHLLDSIFWEQHVNHGALLVCQNYEGILQSSPLIMHHLSQAVFNVQLLSQLFDQLTGKLLSMTGDWCVSNNNVTRCSRS